MFYKPNLEDYKNKSKNFIIRKNTNPLISVITISKNSEKTIQKTIDSLKNQKLKNFEHIIIDSNSTDRTIPIVKENLDFVDVLVSEKDKNPSDGINKGIALSKGDLIFWLSSDDWIDDNITSIIEQNYKSDNNISFFFGNMVMHNINGIRTINPKDNCVENLLKGNPEFTYPAIVFNKKVFEEFGLFSTDIKINNDFEFILRILKKKRNVKYVKEFNVNRLPGGMGEKSKFINLYETLIINIFYKNLSFFTCKYILIKSFQFSIISIKETIRFFLSKLKFK